MSRKTKFSLKVYALMFMVGLGLLILVGALGDKLARWGGYADSLPLLALLVLFVVGSLVLTPRRRSPR